MFRVLVTTSYLNAQAYAEFKSDGHPIVVISGRDIVEILRSHGYGDKDSGPVAESSCSDQRFAPHELTHPDATLLGMAFAIALTDEQWELVADLFDPPGRRGAPARIPRRRMVEAMLFIARTGCQWRYLPERYGAWSAVWAQWRRWRANGVWGRAMVRLAAVVRVLHDGEPGPSMVMIDAQTVKGARYGPTFHEAGGRGGRTMGTKRTILVGILGLPIAAHAGSARPHDVTAARELLREQLPELTRLSAIVGDRAYRGLTRLAARKGLQLDIKAPPPGRRGFVPIAPLYRIEHTFAQLGRWRRLSRCYEGSEASARAWLEVASVGYLAWRAVA